MKLVAMILAGVLALAIANAADDATSPSGAPAKTAGTKSSKASSKKTDEKAAEVKTLVIEDVKTGTGKLAVKGKTIKVNYTGWLYDPKAPATKGKQFDSSVGKEAFSFALGAGQVIKGWDDGFENMKVGGKRKLIIPASLGYGERGAGNVIPPNSALVFEVELLDVM